jgi:hypothetical protein
VTVGDGVTSIGQYTSIQAAIAALPASGGEVCILPGRYFEYVILDGLKDIVLYGCGGETRIASPSSQPPPLQSRAPAAGAVRAAAVVPASGLSAVITAVACTNVTIRSLAVEAADGDAGILLDGVVPGSGEGAPAAGASPIFFRGPVYCKHVTLSDLTLTASTRPALVAIDVIALVFRQSRVAMEDVESRWSAVWVSGRDVRVEHNWIGLQDDPDALVWIPATVVNDVPAGFRAAPPATPAANGGIQVAGTAIDVFVVDNAIQGGLRNGIALGSFNTAKDTIGKIFGLVPPGVDPAAAVTLLLGQGGNAGALISSGVLENVQIARNRIRNVGLCGIGPVGFFDLATTVEVIRAKNVVIHENVITGSLQDTLAATAAATGFGYGAICLADVENLVVADNVITDFGSFPGAPVCGIFVLCGEQVAIDRNQVIETRDWAAADPRSATDGGPHAGILVMFVTPPALSQKPGSAWSSSFSQGGSLLAPLYQPGLPALRIENNVVRVALGYALEVVGFGPFSIRGNHFATGGTIPTFTASTFTPAASGPSGYTTVVILNLGLLIEVGSAASSFGALFNNGAPSPAFIGVRSRPFSTSGAVVFSDNMCQLEARVSDVQAAASVAILSLDHVLFTGNHLWIDAARQTTSVDALILAVTLQVNDNRFQEALGSVGLGVASGAGISAATIGVMNVTVNNIATYCLLIEGARTIASPNLVLESRVCKENGTFGATAATNRTFGLAATAADVAAAQSVQARGLVQSARVAQFARAAAELSAQFGPSSPQAQAAEAAVTSSKTTAAQLAILYQHVALKVPTVPSAGFSLYGHVYHSGLEAASAYTVFVVDAQNAYQDAIGFTYTASDGSYVLNYTPAPGAALPEQLFLQIANDKGQPVYLASSPLQPQTGAATLTDVTLPAGEPAIGDPPAALRAIAFPAPVAGSPKPGTPPPDTPPSAT